MESKYFKSNHRLSANFSCKNVSTIPPNEINDRLILTPHTTKKTEEEEYTHKNTTIIGNSLSPSLHLSIPTNNLHISFPLHSSSLCPPNSHSLHSHLPPTNGPRAATKLRAMARILNILPLLTITLHLIILISAESESEILLKFKDSLQNAGALSGWTIANPPCSGDHENWVGVFCEEDRVWGLQLQNMGLEGIIDVDALAKLPNLRTLSLMSNNFDGPLPNLTRLSALKSIYLSNNQFSGVIQPGLFNGMVWLKKVYLANNKLSGPIPVSLAALPKLMELMLENNEFVGEIPQFPQDGIKIFNVSYNELVGPIPSSLINFSALAFAGNRSRSRTSPDWPTRLKIVKGVGQGLLYLYNELPSLTAPHGHLKSSNVLLDGSYAPLLADYGLVPVVNQEYAQEHMISYKSPEYKQSGRITKKTDVWSLGILILEVMTGRFPSNFVQQGGAGDADIVALVESAVRGDGEAEVFDADMIRSERCEGEMMKLLKIGLSCCEVDVDRRPDIREAIERIEEIREE